MAKRQKRNGSKPETTVEYNFTVFFEPAVEGGYVVSCPEPSKRRAVKTPKSTPAT
jgi:hypothetical protein